jgi:hypothetical protein
MRMLKPLSVGVAGAAIALVAAACGGSSSSSSTTTTQSPAQATAVITTNWTTFFDGNNPNSGVKLALLQNNGKLAATFQKNFAGNASTAAMTAAKVTNVTVLPASQCQQAAVPSPCAKVSYDLVNRQNGSPLLAGQTGYAVFVNGKWQISENTFCALIALAGSQCPA